MNSDMKFWILTIMDMNSKLDYYCANLEKRIDNLSVCLTKSTLFLFNEILALNDKKVLLINLKVMYDSLVAALKKDERLIVEEYVKNRTLDTIARSLGVNRSTVMRRLNKAVQKSAAVLAALGYSDKKLKDEYYGYAPVYSVFCAIKREHFARQAAAKAKCKIGSPDFYGNFFEPDGCRGECTDGVKNAVRGGTGNDVRLQARSGAVNY